MVPGEKEGQSLGNAGKRDGKVGYLHGKKEQPHRSLKRDFELRPIPVCNSSVFAFRSQHQLTSSLGEACCLPAKHSCVPHFLITAGKQGVLREFISEISDPSLLALDHGLRPRLFSLICNHVPLDSPAHIDQ